MKVLWRVAEKLPGKKRRRWNGEADPNHGNQRIYCVFSGGLVEAVAGSVLCAESGTAGWELESVFVFWV